MQRGLDVVGICTINNVNILLLVLPMTDITGALFVKKRIDKDIPQHEFLVDGITVHVDPVITALSYNNKLTPDTASYFKAIYQLYYQPKLQ
jgi:hypothetical protein